MALNQKPLKHHKILKVKLTSTTKGLLLAKVEEIIKSKQKIYITTPNPEIVLQAQSDSKLLKALNKAAIALPDGIGLVMAARLFGFNLMRITGREVMEELLIKADKNKWKVYFLGASEDVNKKAIKKAENQYPKMKIRGNSGPLLNREAYSELERDIKSYNYIIRDINKFRPNILLVAFGAPKQEKFLYDNFSNLNFNVALTVGGGLDYYAGKMTKPPKWVSKGGLEWLWRLGQNPGRVKRIFNAIVVFPIFTFLYKIKKDH